MDLYIDQDCFSDGRRDLLKKKSEMETLRTDIKTSFDQLRSEWDSEAGRIFFQKFEDDLLKNLERYATVFEYMATNLSTASQKYDAVFRDADAVAQLQY